MNISYKLSSDNNQTNTECDALTEEAF